MTDAPSPAEPGLSEPEAVAGEAERPRRSSVHGLRLEIDTDLCVGFGDCVDVAPDAFRLDEDGVAFLTEPESVDRATLLEACRSCPVDAIVARDEDGDVVAP